jgi:hypothetical protein
MAALLPRQLSRTTSVAVLATAPYLTGCSASPKQSGHGTDADGNSPRHPITFQADGNATAGNSWSASTGGTAAHAALPWHKTVQQATGTRRLSPTVVLGRGGRATCSVSVDGRQVKSPLSQRTFGHAAWQTAATTGGISQSDA